MKISENADQIDAQPKSAVRSVEIAALLSSVSPSEALATLEERIANLPSGDVPSFRRQIIESLDAAFRSGTSFTRDWLKAILEAAPIYIRAKDERREPSAAKSLEEQLHELLARAMETKTPFDRGDLVGSVIAELRDISLLCHFFRSVDEDWTAERAKRDAKETYFGEYTEGLRNQLLNRVLGLAKTDELWLQASPSSILWFWWGCDQEQQVYVFTKKAMQQTNSLVALLNVPVERSCSSDGDYDLIQVRRWSKIIDFHTLENRALELALSGPSREARTRARRFLDAYATGKSELFK